jgi:hypothetical protein
MLLREFFYSDVRSARFIESQEIGSFKESLPFSVRDDNADFQISSTYHTLDVSAGVQYQRARFFRSKMHIETNILMTLSSL